LQLPGVHTGFKLRGEDAVADQHTLLPYSTRDSTHHAINLALVAQFAQLTNYYQIFWDGDTMIPGTGQMWSLAVEEHFYLLFPLVLSLLLQRRDYRHIGFIFAAACVAVWPGAVCFCSDLASATTTSISRPTPELTHCYTDASWESG
jgi:peptidoglycan/LPS O-acetylase OafA/YrhL